MTATITPGVASGRIGVYGYWRIDACAPRWHCQLCGNPSRWVGLVGAYGFVCGRACGEHWTDLLDVTKSMATGWQPCPCPSPDCRY